MTHLQLMLTLLRGLNDLHNVMRFKAIVLREDELYSPKAAYIRGVL